MLGDHSLVAGAEIDVAEQAEQFVGTVAAEDVGGIEPVHVGDRLAQLRRLPIRIALELVGSGTDGRDRLGARAKRRFIG